MKKIVLFLLTLVMGLSLFTACGSDPVAEEYEKFLNTDMTKVNANYEALKTEVGKWESFKTDAEIADSIEKVMLPNIDESLDILSKIELSTDEVKAIKEKYNKMLVTYKEGYSIMLEACKSGDADKINDANAKIDEGINLLDEYNKALESLAKEKDMTVQY